jgi:hypothetical protein
MIYKDLELLPENLHGWNGNHSIFETLIQETQPNTIIEVGSWVGQSAITMAKTLKKHNLNSKIYCIDTWLGALEFMTWLKNTPERNLLPKNGYPQVYYQFLSNVVHNNVSDYIIPVPNTSAIGAKYLSYNNIKAKLIYIDASHEEEDVYNDVLAYSQLIEPGGIIFGDDYQSGWPGVQNAINKYSSENNKHLEIIDNNFWVLRF